MIRRLSSEKTDLPRKSKSGVRKAGLVMFAGGIAVATLLCAPHTPVRAQSAANSTAAAQQQAAQQQAAQQPSKSQDGGERSKVILAHLNAVLRFYRDSEAPIQKVGEPSDLVYRDQAVTLATQIGGFAFQSAKAEAALMEQSGQGGQTTPEAGSQSQRLQQTRKNLEQQIADRKTQDADLAKQLETASGKKRVALEQQQQEVEGELGLQTAMADALAKIIGMAGAANDTGFAAQINQLERSTPGFAAGKPTTAAPTLESLSAARSAGVSSQAQVLFQLLGTRESIDNLITEGTALHQQVLALRTPLVGLLKETIAQGQALSQNPAPLANPPATGATKTAPPAGAPSAVPAPSTEATFNHLIATFKAISAASVPLSQELLTLEQSQASLQAWRAAVNDEYHSIMRSLLLRVVFIAVALLVIFALGEVWNRAARRYVHDIRRRRQILVVRRLITGFLSGLVLIFGLVTQFSSLATFAGFITAGIAVGLQTILLSVAAYFFIIGRYGVKVGDRITVAGVTGDVIEVGIVRFNMMEMAGSGTSLYPTGRVAVFSNAVLFQAGIPLYKQMPGTHYAWHEMTVKLSADADYLGAVQEILKALQKVYETYGSQVERQHKNLESWMDSSFDAPDIQSNVQFVDGALQLWVRFPVILRQAATTDEQMTEALLQLMSSDEKVKAAVSSPPAIKAAVRG